MSEFFDARDTEQLLPGLRKARQAIGRGELIVMPTDTVYGIAADAFSASAVAALLAAKGRGRQSPPPVLVAGLSTMRALVSDVPAPVERLVEEFWPGGLTIVLPSQPSLSWDLGDTGGTVAVRMPADRIALELLEDCGPLAVSSANLTGKAAAVDVHSAYTMLRDSVSVYLDGGPSSHGVGGGGGGGGGGGVPSGCSARAPSRATGSARCWASCSSPTPSRSATTRPRHEVLSAHRRRDGRGDPRLHLGRLADRDAAQAVPRDP